MKKRIFSRVLALVMALSLLSTTAFAAQVLNQDNIGTFTDSTTGALLAHDNNGGVAEANAAEKYYDYYLGSDVTLNQSLVVKDNVNASLDLNGYTLQLNDSSQVIKDADGYTTGIKVADSSGTVKYGSVIMVTGEDTMLTVTDDGVDGVQRGDGVGTITGGNNTGRWEWWTKYGSGGGVYVNDGATFEMTGGQVSGNATQSVGGGVAAIRHAGDLSDCPESKMTTVILNNVDITENVELARGTGTGGGGVYIDGWCKGELNNTNVVNNYSNWAGGGIYGWANANILINGGEISHNSSVAGGGIRVLGAHQWYVDLAMNNVKMEDNRVTKEDWSGGAIAGAQSNITLNNVLLTNNSAPGYGGALHLTNNTNLTLKGNNQAYDNTAGLGGKDIYSDAHITSVDGGNINNVLPWGYIEDEGNIHEGDKWYAGWSKDPNAPPEPVDPDDPTPPNQDDTNSTTIPDTDTPLTPLPTGGADAATTTIEDEETPLAGLFTRADAIGYLWEQTGSPEADLSDFEDVPEDHYWAVAIGWAQDMGIALPDEEGNFRPDDLVLRTSDEPEGELQEFLNRYAVFAGVELEDGELFIELDGEAEDFIMGEEAQVIFDEFFAKLEAALAAQAA